MDLFQVVVIALGLAMDAFAVSIASGILLKKPQARHYFRLAFHFGLFQFMMPVIGWYAGQTVEHFIGSFDHWVAFALLTVVGGRMIWESRKGEAELVSDPSRGWNLIALSVATSIDAFAVGLSLAFVSPQIWGPAAVIGVVTLVLSAVGLGAGARLGKGVGRTAQVVGGVFLILIGLKILFEHIGG